ncbi:MAG: PQ-loop repeat-containing protein [Candidatus Liptonbacteria bacterium]|nr:PQ-loop repeat-containing protein [Candidatus Liptonbacteria bacterium]
MNYSELLGFLGTALAIIAYMPQIIHLLKVHCSAGISRFAYAMWLVASAFLLIHALMINDKVFTALMGFNLAANTLIFLYANIYKRNFCESHMPINMAGAESLK